VPGRHRSDTPVARDNRTLAVAAAVGIMFVAVLVWLVLR